MSLSMHSDPQVAASDPARSVFVTANAGSGKTSTLVKRVARLLLRGAAPETILCVTYTKAAAAEMQRRLFDELGGWAVMADAPLAAKLAELDEPAGDLSDARALFARALETPGGLKIQTIHAFCEKLLRRFPLEAGISPGFRVLEDAAAREISARAREDVAHLALMDADGPIGAAYAHFSVELDWQGVQPDVRLASKSRRDGDRSPMSSACEQDGYAADVWARCGFATSRPRRRRSPRWRSAGIDWAGWRCGRRGPGPRHARAKRPAARRIDAGAGIFRRFLMRSGSTSIPRNAAPFMVAASGWAPPIPPSRRKQSTYR